ncbi:DinB family protein [Tenacibaculum sp. MEBiC06402]|uniref:DinB family protein n=1 Tax=unclassified Tenacibaculum TaxID=2635139 RepID=UPI003B9B8525
MLITELQPNEFDIYYKRYIDKLPQDISLLQSFLEGKKNTIRFFSSIPESKLEYRYQNEKWSVKEIFQHLIDTERIFMNRCFRIARRDTTPLSGFDQNVYIKPSGADQKSIENLINEFTINREHSINFLNSISNEDLCFIGNANSNAMSARAAAFVIPGHDIWHQEIIKERYL